MLPASSPQPCGHPFRGRLYMRYKCGVRKRLLVIAILFLALLGVAAARVMATWEIDRIEPDGIGLYSILRPCGSGYQRVFSLPQWLVVGALLSNFVIPGIWVVRRVRKHLIQLRNERKQRRGFEVIFERSGDKDLQNPTGANTDRLPPHIDIT